jgi:hypothetical protein
LARKDILQLKYLRRFFSHLTNKHKGFVDTLLSAIDCHFNAKCFDGLYLGFFAYMGVVLVNNLRVGSENRGDDGFCEWGLGKWRMESFLMTRVSYCLC